MNLMLDSFCYILKLYNAVSSPLKQMSISFHTKEKSERPECIALPVHKQICYFL